jgi:streptogramin lyase
VSAETENFFSDPKWNILPHGERYYHPTRKEVWSYAGSQLYINNPENGEEIRVLSVGDNYGVLPAGYVYVNSLAFDASGNVWLAHWKGVSRYNEASNTYTHYQGEGFTDDGVEATKVVFNKEENVIMAGCLEGFMYAKLNDQGLPIAWETFRPDSLTGTSPYVVHEIGFYKTEMWVFNEEGVYRFANGKWSGYSPDDMKMGVGGGIGHAGFVDVFGNVWLSGGNDEDQFMFILTKFDRQSEEWQRVEIPGFRKNGAQSLVIDRNNIMWTVGYEDTLFRVDLNVSPLTAKKMAEADYYDLLSTTSADPAILSLNPVGGLMLTASSFIEDTTGIGEYYANVSVRPSRLFPSLSERRGNGGSAVEFFSPNGRKVSANRSFFSSGNYFAVRRSNGSTIVEKYLGLTANPSQLK